MIQLWRSALAWELIREIFLEELRYLPAIDTEKQNIIKSYIDDLVFALYFEIPVKETGIKHTDEIHEICLKNEYYKLLF